MKYPKIEIPKSTSDKLLTAGLIIAGLFFAKRALGKAAKTSADEQISKDPSAGQARILDTAMNPSGQRWLWYVDGANQKLILDTATQIKDLSAVERFYKSQTKGSLLDDLRTKLSTDNMDKFLALTTGGKSGSKKYLTNRTDIPANMWVVTNADANVRKTAAKTSKYGFSDNIVKTVSKGKALGISTGKYSYDQNNDTTFIEFYTMGSKSQTAGKQFYYVAKSQVDLLTKEQKAQREKSGQKFPLEVLAGLLGTSEQKQVVTKHSTVIYNEQFKTVSSAPANTIVGFPILTLDTGTAQYTKVQTVQGLIRWVNTQDIQIQNRL